MADERLKTRLKVESLLLVYLGVRPCSQTTMPVDLPGAGEMGRIIDEAMAPKMALLQAKSDPKRRLATIISIKKDMKTAYDEVVVDSEQYNAHLDWPRDLGLLLRIADVRPTIQEIYMFKEKGTGDKLRKLMKKREKIKAQAYRNVQPGMDRVSFAYPEEFNKSWLRSMGEVLGYPGCCVEGYASDRVLGVNVEKRAAEQLDDMEDLSMVDPLAYFVRYFFPCRPNCDAALTIGRKSLSLLSDLDTSLGEIYTSLVVGNMEFVHSQPKITARTA